MKNIIFYISAFVSLACFSGCNAWLDVKPVDRVTDETLFSEGIGAQNALNGIYQYISSPNLYGRNMSWGLYSALGQDYLMGTDVSQEYRFAAGTFEHQQAPVVILMENIWGNSYRAIANSNKLIQELGKMDEDLFRYGNVEKDLIHGEALAIRGLMHFELLRLFAPAPKQSTTGRYVPYVNRYPAYATAPATTADVIKNIVEDLKKAKDLVAANDTILHRSALSGRLFSRMTGSMAEDQRFFTNRNYRLTHVAISGLLAKVYLYAGDLDNAKKEGEYLYTKFGPHSTPRWWEFTPQANATGASRYFKLVNDVLFATYDEDMIANIDDYKTTAQRYRLSKQIPTWFPPAERDFRTSLHRVDAVSAAGLVSEKWLENTSTAQFQQPQNKLSPVLRFSEVYYIYSEALFLSGETVEAMTVLNQVRVARGKTALSTSLTDPEGYYRELLAEYRREFLTEGQTVFAYKRLGRDIQIGTQTIPMDGRFTFAVPQGELIF